MNNLVLVNRYRLDNPLGQGGMGTVYKGHDLLLNRPVAVKMVSSTELGTQGRARLLREAQSAARLNHPNIVSIFDAGESNESAYIVMELLEGQTLLSCMGQPIQELLPVLDQICNALEHAHSQGIIHRDLKPENIILTKNGTAKLTDFGLARKEASRITIEGAVVGTVFYMAPEQAMGKDLDPRTDLYSLGVMIYELITGRLPFTATDPLAVITQHLYSPVIPPATYSPGLLPELDKLVLRLMSKLPEDRPASATEVRRELQLCTMKLISGNRENVRLPGESIQRGALVGREKEFTEARKYWLSTVSATSETHLLLLTGETGVGKTPFLRELKSFVEITGGRSLSAECYAEGLTPYMPMAEIIRTGLFLRGTPPTSAVPRESLTVQLPNLILADLVTLAPDLNLAFPDLPHNVGLEAQAEQARLFESAVSFFTQLQNKQPILLVIENAQYADGGTVSLLRHLIRRTRTIQLKLLVVLSYRESEAENNPVLRKALLEFNQEHFTVRVKLTRYDQSGTELVLKTILGNPVSPDLVDIIYRETEGNLFFIEELVETLLLNGSLALKEGKWENIRKDSLELPQSVKAAIQSRLTHLSDETMDTLNLAAIIGREFDFTTLQRASDQNEEVLISSLETAVNQKIIQESRGKGGETFQFVHGLFPTTIVDNLSNLRKHRLHRKVASAIAEIHPNDFASLAMHYAASGDRNLALNNYIIAANQASKIFSNTDAIRFFSNALDLLPVDSLERFDLLLQRFRLYSLLGQHDNRLIDAQEMLELALGNNDLARHCDALTCLAEYYLDNSPEKGWETAEQAIELARNLGDLIREARAQKALGYAFHIRGKYEAGKTSLTRAANLFREAGQLPETADSLHTLSLIWLDLGKPKAARQAAEEALTLSQQAGDRQQEATSLRRIAICLINENQAETALSYAEKALQLHRQLGCREDEIHALNVLGIIHAQLLHPSEAESFMQASLEASKETGFLVGAVNASINLVSLVYQPRGDFEKALHFIKSQLTALMKNFSLYALIGLERVHFSLLLNIGQVDEALELSQAYLRDRENELTASEITNFSLGISRALSLKGQHEAALQTIQEALEVQRSLSHPIEYAACLMARGLIYIFLGGNENAKLALADSKMADSLLVDIDKGVDFAEIYLISAMAYLRLGESKLAFQQLQVAEEIMKKFPVNSVEFFLIAGYVYYANGLPKEGEAAIDKAYDWIQYVASKFMDLALRSSWLKVSPINLALITREQMLQGIIPALPEKIIQNEAN